MTEESSREFLTEDEFRMVYSYQPGKKKTFGGQLRDFVKNVDWKERAKITFLSLPRSFKDYSFKFAANDVISGLIL